MRAVRQVFVALLAVALFLVPAAGFARVPAMQHAMGVDAPEDACPCCDASHDTAVDVCMLKCCGAPAVLAEVQPLAEGRAVAVADTAAAALAPFARPPDPPPPRS